MIPDLIEKFRVWNRVKGLLKIKKNYITLFLVSMELKIIVNDASNWVTLERFGKKPNWLLERRGWMNFMILA